VRLTPDHDALDVANKVGPFLWFCVLYLYLMVSRLVSSNVGVLGTIFVILFTIARRAPYVKHVICSIKYAKKTLGPGPVDLTRNT